MAETTPPKQGTRYVPDAPRGKRIDTTEVTYDELMAQYAAAGQSNPYLEGLTEGVFTRTAASPEADSYRQYAAEQNAQWDLATAKRENALLDQENQRIVEEQEAEWQRKIDDFDQFLQGQTQGTTENLVNATEIAAGLLALEGEENADARAAAAIAFAQNQQTLKPHIEALLGEDWWANNWERINENLPKDERGFWTRAKDNAVGGVAWAARSQFGDYIFDALATTEQSAANALGGFRAAIDRGDGVSAEDSLQFAGSSLGRMPWELAKSLIPGLSSAAANGERYLTTDDGRVLSFDLNGDGTVNLREAVGRSNELSDLGQQFASGLERISGGAMGEGAAERIVGAFDTAGLAAIDPLSWTGLNQASRARVALNTLEESGNSAAIQYARMARAGATEIPEYARLAALREWSTAVRNGARTRGAEPGLLRRLDNRIRSIELDERALRRRQVELWDDAVRRGGARGFRIGATTVIPTDRVLDFLRIAENADANAASWFRRVEELHDLANPDELLHFVRSFDGKEVPERFREQISNWSSLAGAMSENPDEWMRSIVDAGGSGRQQFEELEAFGRAILGDDAVSNWEELWDEAVFNKFVDDATETPAALRASELTDNPSQPATLARPERWTPGRTRKGHLGPDNLASADGPDSLQLALRDIDELLVRGGFEVTEEGRAAVRANIELFQRPAQYANNTLRMSPLRRVANRNAWVNSVRQAIADKLSTYSRVRNADNLGEPVADFLRRAVAGTEAERSRIAQEFAVRLGVDRKGVPQLAERAAREGEWEAAIDRVLTGGEPEAAVQALRAEGRESTAQLAEVLLDYRKQTTESVIAAGADASKLLDPDTYVPRVRTDEAGQFLRDLDPESLTSDQQQVLTDLGLLDADGQPLEEFSAMGTQGASSIRQDGFFEARRLDPEIRSITEMNEKARDRLIGAGLLDENGELFRLYEDNAIDAMLLRSRSAQEARTYVDLVRNLAGEVDTTGRPLAYVAESADDVASTFLKVQADDATSGGVKYTAKDLPGGGRIWVNSTVYDELERTRQLVGSQREMSKFNRILDEVNNRWALLATVPNPAFHSRNNVGNWFNMYLNGVQNPEVITRAANIQRRMGQIEAAMRRDGSSFDEALSSLNLKPELARTIEQIRATGISNGGNVADLLRNQSGNSVGTGRITSVGRAVGQGIENNARIATFIDGLDKGMSPTQAATRTRQALFDYGDLTMFEGDRIRLLSRFYTFTRKNTALQATMLAQNPGRIANANRLTEEFQDSVMSMMGFERDTSGEYEVPEWMGPMAAVYDNGRIVGTDTPFAAATDTFETLRTAMLTPAWVASAMAGDGEPLQQSMRNTMSLLSGAPVGGVVATAEVLTGVDTFTGRPLEVQDRTAIDRITRFTDILFPVGSMIDRNLEGFGAYERLGVFQEENYRVVDEDGNIVYDGDDLADAQRTAERYDVEVTQGPGDRGMGSERLLNAVFGLRQYYLDGWDTEAGPTPLSVQQRAAVAEEIERALYEAQKLVPREERLTVEDLIEMGEVQSRDAVLTHVLYTGRTPANFTEEDMEWLRRQVPKSISDDLGLNRPADEPAKDMTPEEAARNARARISAINAWLLSEGRPPLTEADEDNIIKYSLGLTMSELEGDVGVQAYRARNPFELTEDGTAPDPEVIAQANRDHVAEVLRLTGRGSLEDFIEANPLLTRFELEVQQKREAGWTEDMIAQDVIEGLSRERRAILMGEDSLDETRQYERYTDEERERMEKKILEETNRLDYTFRYLHGRPPSREEVRFYMAQVFFTSPEQDAVGVDRYSAPRAENITSDEVYADRLNTEAEMLDRLAGTDFLTSLGN